MAGRVTPSFKPNVGTFCNLPYCTLAEYTLSPQARAVYARDVLDIDPFSSVKGVEIDVSDDEFAAKFATGAVSRAWQEEVCTDCLLSLLAVYICILWCCVISDA